MKRIINTLVISGGGVKGISYIGVLKYLDELKLKRTQLESKKDFVEDECDIPKFNIKQIRCVSAGSIISLLYIIGYSYDELIDEILSKDLSDLKDLRIKNFLEKYGFDSGKRIMTWIEGLIIKKGYSKDITFRQIFEKFKIQYQVVTTNLNKYETVIFDNISNPNLKVTKAIRMSIGVPFIFSVEKYNNEIYVDGGLINNYPIKEFDNKLDNVLGLKLVTRGEFHKMDENIDSFYSYLGNLMTCYMVQKERETTLSYKYRDHTIGIEAQKITGSINFSLTKDDKLHLIDLGYLAAKKYFEKDPVLI